MYKKSVVVPMKGEVVSHKLLSDLKYDVEALKKKLTQPDTKTHELILEIESLKDSIHELTAIFKKSLDEVKEEDLSKTMKDKMDSITSQNETIARGMVAISDKLEEFMKGSMPMPAAAPQVKHSFGMPAPVTGKVAPRPMEEPQQTDLPPPPPRVSKKRGIFK